MTLNDCPSFLDIKFFVNNIFAIWDRALILPPSRFSPQGGSIHVLCDPKRSLGDFDLRSTKVKVTDWPKEVMSHITGCVLMKRTLWHLSYVSSSYQSKVMEINVYWPYDVIIWPQLTCQGVKNTKLYLNCHPLHNSSSFWTIWRDLIGIWDTSNFICICICI